MTLTALFEKTDPRLLVVENRDPRCRLKACYDEWTIVLDTEAGAERVMLGTGPTREAAIAQAVALLGWIKEGLQGEQP